MLEDPERTIVVVPSAPAYADQLAGLMAANYGVEPGDETFTADHFRSHISRFAEGQFMALDTATDTVVGFTASMRVTFDPARPVLARWWAAVGEGWLTTHEPDADWMYGVETCVRADWRGQGVGGRLMDARFEALRRLNLRGLVAGSAIIDYDAVADSMPVEDYVREVVEGRRFDTNLTKQLHKGFAVRGLVPDYTQDIETRGWAVLIVWDNPDYRPREKSPVPLSRVGAASLNRR